MALDFQRPSSPHDRLGDRHLVGSGYFTGGRSARLAGGAVPIMVFLPLAVDVGAALVCRQVPHDRTPVYRTGDRTANRTDSRDARVMEERTDVVDEAVRTGERLTGVLYPGRPPASDGAHQASLHHAVTRRW